MENSAIKSSKKLQIRLIGHCIICLRKVSRKRKLASELEDLNGDNAQPEVAPKSVVATPGFLTIFNQVWEVLQTKWMEKNNVTKTGSLEEESGVFLKSVLETGGVSTNVSFSKMPTICEVCCDKVVAVENLMKALRQQLREIRILLEKGRRGQNGEFEKSLREKGLEESVIRTTLQFVGIFEMSCSQVDFLVPTVDDKGAPLDTEFNGQNDLEGRPVDSDDEGETMSGAEDVDDDGDPDYIEEEPEENDIGESTDDEDESEEDMEVYEDDDKNDPDFKVEKDPLALFPEKRKEKPVQEIKWTHRFEGQAMVQEKKTGEGESRFGCSCGKMFATFENCRNHMRKNPKLHPEYKPFKGNVRGWQNCELCGKRILPTDILQHYTEDHLNGQDELVIKCPNEKCRYMFVSLAELKAHFRIFKECKINGKEGKWGEPVCKTCGFTGKNLLKIKTHLGDKHENGKEKKWKCSISNCGKMFCEKQSFHLHVSQHRFLRGRAGITKQSCDKCGENLKVEEMEGHLKIKHGVNEVIGCKQCSFKFTGRDEMVEHVYEHRGLGIICDICGEDKFDRYVAFREHYFVVHKLCPKKYKCGEGGNCEMWFWTKETKEKHELKMHRKESTISGGGVRGKKQEKLRCDMCDNEYVTEDSLIKHRIKVHGADPFSCDICGETFDDKRRFLRHKKEHTGIVFQKEWKCEVEGCGKTFKAKKLWKHHVEIGHTGHRPHVCEECGKGYTFADTLRRHRDAVHLGLRRWVCEECGEGFSSSTVLKRHKLIHTGERPFECEICGQKFRHKSVLGTHLKGHEEKGEGFKPNGPMKQIRKRKIPT